MIDLKYVEIINKCQNLNGLILVLERMMDEELVLTELRDSLLEDLVSQEDIRKTILRLFSKDLISNPLVFNMPEIVKFMEMDKVDGTLTIRAFKMYYYNAVSFSFEDLITAIFLTMSTLTKIEELDLQKIIKPDKKSWIEVKIEEAKKREDSGYEQDFLNEWHPKEDINTTKEDNIHIQISSDPDFKYLIFDGILPEEEQDKHKQLEELFLKVRKYMSKRGIRYGSRVVSKNKLENLKWVSREENIVKTDNVLPLTSDENINNSINSMVAMIDNVEGLLLWLHTQDKYRETILYHNDSVIDKFRGLSLIEYFGVDVKIEKLTMVLTNIYRFILILMYNQKYGVTLTNTLDRDTRNIIDFIIQRYTRGMLLQNSEYKYICKKILSFKLKEIKN